MVAPAGADDGSQLQPSALVLVDYDNLYPEPPEDPISLLRHDFAAIARVLSDVVPNLELISIRLYGGWTHAARLSRHASDVQSIIGAADPFPMVHPQRPTVLHGSIELAVRLLCLPTVDLPDTVRPHLGLPHTRLAGAPVPMGCVQHPATCPATILRRFTRKGGGQCPSFGCPVTNRTAFVRLEQKMVDTMITCDALHACQHDGHAAMLVLTADIDLMPCLMAAAAMQTSKVHVGPARHWDPSEREALESVGAGVLELL
jgi:hypothetical protein